MNTSELIDLLRDKIDKGDATLTVDQMNDIGERLAFLESAMFVTYDPASPYTDEDVKDGVRDELTLRLAGMSSAIRHHSGNNIVPNIPKPRSSFECGWNEYADYVNHPEIFTDAQTLVWKPFKRQ